jgi:phosphoribosylaminoimidazole (AIR) synthetase
MDGAMDRLIHRRFPMRHHDRLAAIAARFDHAAFVVMAGLVADFVAEVHIYSPDAIPKAVQRGMHNGFHVVRKLLAALNVAICSNLDQHQSTPLLHRLERLPIT